MRLAQVILILSLVAACGRPLTGAESDLASRLFGETLDVSVVRIGANGLVGAQEHRFPMRPRTTCRERLSPPSDEAWLTGRTAGIALFNTVQVRRDVARPDFSRTPDGQMHLGAAMFLVHELTHVWQWQNRDVTGYSPWGVAREHEAGADPYLFDADANPRFLDYGYEQQASLVEEYVCCQALDPEGARTARLRRLLAQVMEPDVLPDVDVMLPWDGVQTRGICS